MTTITITVPPSLDDLAKSVGTTAQDVIENFIRDLCALPGSNGSDERMHADAWFNRVLWPLLDYEGDAQDN